MQVLPPQHAHRRPALTLCIPAGERGSCRAAHLEGARPRCGGQRITFHRLRLLRQQHHGARCSPLSCAVCQVLRSVLPLPSQILSGDVIEATVGGALSLSTMAAAGCGNMVSDVLGIGISGQIEVRAAPTCCCLASLRLHGTAPHPCCAAYVRCNGVSLAAHRSPDAAAHHPECVVAVHAILPQRCMTRASCARGDDRQQMSGRGIWLRAGHVPAAFGKSRRCNGCRGCGSVACSNTVSADEHMIGSDDVVNTHHQRFARHKSASAARVRAQLVADLVSSACSMSTNVSFMTSRSMASRSEARVSITPPAGVAPELVGVGA